MEVFNEEKFYSEKLMSFGPNDARSVGWVDRSTQNLRFEVLYGLLFPNRGPREIGSVLDYGCGLGHMYGWLSENEKVREYVGYDRMPFMVEQARRKYVGKPGVVEESFVSSLDEKKYDYVVGCGVFSLRLGNVNYQDWCAGVQKSLDEMWERTTIGMAFNLATMYHDYESETMRYADPAWWMMMCLHRYSRYVSLRMDYQLYEFAISVRRQSS